MRYNFDVYPASFAVRLDSLLNLFSTTLATKTLHLAEERHTSNFGLMRTHTWSLIYCLNEGLATTERGILWVRATDQVRVLMVTETVWVHVPPQRAMCTSSDVDIYHHTPLELCIVDGMQSITSLKQ